MIDAIHYAATLKKQETKTTGTLQQRIINECEKNPWLKGGKNLTDMDDYQYSFTWKNVHELKDIFRHGNWALRMGLCLQINKNESLIFVQQVNGGDEWLTLKHTGSHVFAFESISWGIIIEKYGNIEYNHTMNRLINATDDQLKKLDY